MILEKIKENRAYLLGMLPFLAPVFFSGMILQSHLDKPIDQSKPSLSLTSNAPTKYKMGDCMMKTYKSEFEENSYTEIINQVGKEHYSLSTLFYSEIRKQYIAVKSIHEELIEEVDMIAGRYGQLASWKKFNCPDFVNEEGSDLL